MSMMRRGFLSSPTISSMECAPMTFVPLASLLRKSSTFETVRLKATTVKPWSFMFKIKFWPITASPIRAISAFGSILLFLFLSPQLQSFISFQDCLQIRPVHFVHVVEGVQIDRDDFGGVFRQQIIH